MLTGGVASLTAASVGTISASISSDPLGCATVSWMAGFFDKVFTDGFKNALAEGDRRAQNSWKIFGGLFQTDGNSRNPEDQILRRGTWELPQTNLGIAFSQIKNVLSPAEVEYFHGVTLVNSNGGDVFSGMTLSNYIIGKNLNTSINSLSTYNEKIGFYMFVHEFGHTMQSRRSGPLYLNKYGIPSLYDQIFRGEESHDDFWVETDANRRACIYFAGASISGFNYTDFIQGPEYTIGYRPSGYGNNTDKIRNPKWYDWFFW